jgi:triacylglycerol lipase
MHTKLEFALGVLNGAIGDYLARTRNGLAIQMACVHAGAPVRLDRVGLAQAYPGKGPRLVVLVHGLMVTEAVWKFPDGNDYGALLERDLGYTPLYIRYNSGRAIPDNGAALAELLERLVDDFPVPPQEILLLGYSMGGLVIRSACHVASLTGQRWLSLVKRAVYVGTPHLGAPLERVGRTVSKMLRSIDDPYTRLISEIADLRSDGLKDLGDAHLRHEDRSPERRAPSLRDPRHPVPLLSEIQHYLIAGALWIDPRLLALFGDALVPLASATNGVCVDRASIALPPSHVRIMGGLHHVGLANSAQVYEHILSFCQEAPECPSSVGVD